MFCAAELLVLIFWLHLTQARDQLLPHSYTTLASRLRIKRWVDRITASVRACAVPFCVARAVDLALEGDVGFFTRWSWAGLTWILIAPLLIADIVANLLPTLFQVFGDTFAGGGSAAQKFDIFLSHNWGTDGHGRDNHQRVKRIKEGLMRAGLTAWLDEEVMSDDITNQMSDGIERSRLVAVFITARYLDKASGRLGLDDSCKNEFDYAIRRHGTAKVLPIVMEKELKDTSAWHGAVGFKLGGQIYHDMSGDTDADDVRKIAQLSTVIKRRLPTQATSTKHALRRSASGRWAVLKGRNSENNRRSDEEAHADAFAGIPTPVQV